MKFKKLLAIMLVGTTTLSVAACGTSTTAATTASSDNSEESSTEADSADSAASTDASAEASLEGDLSDVIPDQTVTLDVYDQLANYSGEQIGWFAKVMMPICLEQQSLM